MLGSNERIYYLKRFEVLSGITQTKKNGKIGVKFMHQGMIVPQIMLIISTIMV